MFGVFGIYSILFLFNNPSLSSFIQLVQESQMLRLLLVEFQRLVRRPQQLYYPSLPRDTMSGSTHCIFALDDTIVR